MQEGLKIKNGVGESHFLNCWSLRAFGALLSVRGCLKAHKGQIMDVSEIHMPPALATCSLDHTIKLWDLQSGQKLGSLKPAHATGVRSLDYIPEYRGLLASVGLDKLVALWSPSDFPLQPHVGWLEGHSEAVLCAKFVRGTPYLVSIDHKLTIRVWDVRSMSCVQVLFQRISRFECAGLCAVGHKPQFAIYGRRLILFETVSDILGYKDSTPIAEAYPIHVTFNARDRTFLVTTKYRSTLIFL